MGSVGEANRTLFVVAAGNDGADLRRPTASARAIRMRMSTTLPAELKVKFPAWTQQKIDDYVQSKINKYDDTVGLTPCRPKGMGIRQRPLGIGARTSTKGGALSMLQMPDGTYDRGNILCVANADWDGNLAASSNWGPGIVDVAAPGQNLVGTSATGGYSTGSGTSFAAPIVSGIAGMIYSVLPNAQPWLVKCAILSSATSKPLRPANPWKAPFNGLTESDGNYGQRIPYPNESPLTVNGMVQASEAISAALFLDGRVRQAQSTGSWPTCVQKRGFFGGWKNTPVLG
jgi:subtilisin family serine protease